MTSSSSATDYKKLQALKIRRSGATQKMNRAGDDPREGFSLELVLHNFMLAIYHSAVIGNNTPN